MTTTHVTRHVRASRHRVYTALTDARDVARWRFPAAMTCRIHEWDARDGGRLRVSLTYDDAGRAGKTTPTTDTYHGRFVTLVPDELLVEVDEFETDDPAFAGEMTISIRLADTDDGTDIVAVHEGLPAAVSTADNEQGWREALQRLATLVEPATGGS